MNYQKEKGSNPFYNCIKKRKYLGKNLTEEIKVLYMETMTLINKTEDDINGKIAHVHGLEQSIFLRCPYCSKQSIDSVESLSKLQLHFSPK